MKKKWAKPKLISLFRGRPEEAVLALCKATETQAGPEGGSSADCQQNDPPQCSIIGTS